MSTYRMRNLVVAAVLAACAAGLTMIYVAGMHRTAAKQATPLTTVYVAAGDIASGTAGAKVAGELTAKRVPTSAVVANAVTDPAQLAGLVSTQPIYRGQQVSTRPFSSLREQGLVADLSGTMRALQVNGDGNQLLAGTLRDGDHVDVVASIKSGDQGNPQSTIVLRNLLVLRAPQQSATSAGSGYSATLRVSDVQASKLFYVLKNADWSLVLRPLLHATSSSVGIDSAATLLGGSK